MNYVEGNLYTLKECYEFLGKKLPMTLIWHSTTLAGAIPRTFYEENPVGLISYEGCEHIFDATWKYEIPKSQIYNRDFDLLLIED